MWLLNIRKSCHCLNRLSVDTFIAWFVIWSGHPTILQYGECLLENGNQLWDDLQRTPIYHTTWPPDPLCRPQRISKVWLDCHNHIHRPKWNLALIMLIFMMMSFVMLILMMLKITTWHDTHLTVGQLASKMKHGLDDDDLGDIDFDDVKMTAIIIIYTSLSVNFLPKWNLASSLSSLARVCKSSNSIAACTYYLYYILYILLSRRTPIIHIIHIIYILISRHAPGTALTAWTEDAAQTSWLAVRNSLFGYLEYLDMWNVWISVILRYLEYLDIWNTWIAGIFV